MRTVIKLSNGFYPTSIKANGNLSVSSYNFIFAHISFPVYARLLQNIMINTANFVLDNCKIVRVSVIFFSKFPTERHIKYSGLLT